MVIDFIQNPSFVNIHILFIWSFIPYEMNKMKMANQARKNLDSNLIIQTLCKNQIERLFSNAILFYFAKLFFIKVNVNVNVRLIPLKICYHSHDSYYLFKVIKIYFLGSVSVSSHICFYKKFLLMSQDCSNVQYLKSIVVSPVVELTFSS